MATLDDRANVLREQQEDGRFTGIDFIRIEEPCDQTTLRIYLITDGTLLDPPFFMPAVVTPDDYPLLPEHFVIESVTDPSLPPVTVTSIRTANIDGTGSQVLLDDAIQRFYIEITVAEPGDFGLYRLRIDDPFAELNPLENDSPSERRFSRIDPFFNDKIFSFKVGCADDLDCVPPLVECPPEPPVDFPVDYLARDFVSLRNALLDFTSQRYPQWTLPVEADVGMMLAEIMAALGDEFSYVQDRFAREAFLETATQRRSLRKKARLIDFEIHDGRAASTWLELEIDLAPNLSTAPDPPTVKAGSRVFALSESGDRIPFEVGLGLRDRKPPPLTGPTEYIVRPEWNAGVQVPYWFDDSKKCLKVGATELFIEGELPFSENLVTSEEAGEKPRRMVLRTDPGNDFSVPVRRHLVRIREITPLIDPLQGDDFIVTRIRWDPEDALPFEMDQGLLVIVLNVVPATAGETVRQRFVCRVKTATLTDEQLPSVNRQGPLKLPSREREGITLQTETRERAVSVLLGLERTETEGLAFLGDDLRDTTPEIEVVEEGAGGNTWTWVRSLIDAKPLAEVFTLDDGVWRRIRGFRRIGEEIVHRDYATGAGHSVRFGDNEFGAVPSEDQPFEVVFRTGPGARANVAPGTINSLHSDPDNPTDHFKLATAQWWVKSAANPFGVTDGVDPESAEEIRQLAPEAYQAEVLFAVRPKDYGRQAQRFEFVQRAQGTARWTGSWQSIFVAADPFGAANLSVAQRDTLEAWMDCVRQAGRDVIVKDPKTLGIDLVAFVCLEPNAYAAHVVPMVQEVLLGRGLGNRPKGFFHPDNFTFGTPLRRSALESAIQSVPGVRSVRRILVRLRGAKRLRLMRELTLKVGRDQILRLDNDPTRPEAGTLKLFMEGGA